MNNFAVTGEIFAIVVLIIMSAFFAGSETAMTAASRARLHGLAQKGDKRAQQVIDIRHQGERMIGALLMGNSTVNILASSLATSVMIKLFSEGGVFYATAIMTALIVIFAEVMPKTYALYNADKMSTAVAPMVRLTITVFAPFLVVIEAIVKFILNLFGAGIDRVSVGNNIEELRGAIELHQGLEEETQEQRAMLHSILDLDDVWVSEIMTHRQMMKTIDLNQPVNDIVQEVLDSQYTRIPVYKDSPDNIIGVIHAKALLRELQGTGGRAENVNVEKLALEPWFIPDSTSLFDQLQAFRERREHFALVVDEYGSLMGVVTLEDILEEIVGDIDDEHDVAVAGVRKQPNGSYMIDGTVTIRDLNREFEWDFPDENYATLAGLILYEAEKIPEAGQVFNFHGFRFDIVRRQRNQITLVRVTPPKKEDAEQE
ncbi:MAG: Co2 transporter containing domain [Micavibrio sp.]|nr:Co2 transporter containing domain [Micavibrio sp.]